MQCPGDSVKSPGTVVVDSRSQHVGTWNGMLVLWKSMQGSYPQIHLSSCQGILFLFFKSNCTKEHRGHETVSYLKVWSLQRI